MSETVIHKSCFACKLSIYNASLSLSIPNQWIWDTPIPTELQILTYRNCQIIKLNHRIRHSTQKGTNFYQKIILIHSFPQGNKNFRIISDIPSAGERWTLAKWIFVISLFLLSFSGTLLGKCSHRVEVFLYLRIWFMFLYRLLLVQEYVALFWWRS